MRARVWLVAVVLALGLAVGSAVPVLTASEPRQAARGMVVSQNMIASQVGLAVLKDGGTAVDAAVATAFALAVVHPTAATSAAAAFSSTARRPASRRRTTSARWPRPPRRRRCSSPTGSTTR